MPMGAVRVEKAIRCVAMRMKRGVVLSMDENMAFKDEKRGCGILKIE